MGPFEVQLLLIYLPFGKGSFHGASEVFVNVWLTESSQHILCNNDDANYGDHM